MLKLQADPQQLGLHQMCNQEEKRNKDAAFPAYNRALSVCARVCTRVFSLLLLQRENIWPLAPEVSFFISAVPFCVKYIYKGC